MSDYKDVLGDRNRDRNCDRHNDIDNSLLFFLLLVIIFTNGDFLVKDISD